MDVITTPSCAQNAADLSDLFFTELAAALVASGVVNEGSVFAPIDADECPTPVLSSAPFAGQENVCFEIAQPVATVSEKPKSRAFPRVQDACLHCRHLKQKVRAPASVAGGLALTLPSPQCSGHRPICQRCQSLGRTDCVYVARGKPGPKPKPKNPSVPLWGEERQVALGSLGVSATEYACVSAAAAKTENENPLKRRAEEDVDAELAPRMKKARQETPEIEIIESPKDVQPQVVDVVKLETAPIAQLPPIQTPVENVIGLNWNTTTVEPTSNIVPLSYVINDEIPFALSTDIAPTSDEFEIPESVSFNFDFFVPGEFEEQLEPNMGEVTAPWLETSEFNIPVDITAASLPLPSIADIECIESELTSLDESAFDFTSFGGSSGSSLASSESSGLTTPTESEPEDAFAWLNKFVDQEIPQEVIDEFNQGANESLKSGVVGDWAPIEELDAELEKINARIVADKNESDLMTMLDDLASGMAA